MSAILSPYQTSEGKKKFQNSNIIQLSAKLHIIEREKGLIYPSTLSFRADIPLIIKVAYICPYRYTNGSHIPLPL